jgi:murein DD-endopeptidase MepM/ murein hydrolase activator NlpD
MTVIATCARCDGELALHSGRPRVVGGRIELLCAACWDHRDTPLPAMTQPVAIAAPPSRKRRALGGRVAAIAGAFALGVGGVVAATHGTAPAAAALPAIDLVGDDAGGDQIRLPIAEPAADDPAPPDRVVEPGSTDGAGTADQEDDAGAEPGVGIVTELENEPILEDLPTLKDWIHPVTGEDELTPAREQRRFGAKRWGIDRTDCGGGHCGVDLAGPRGRPVVAVAWGTVVRIERSENGRDGKSGRYVRIEHPDGVFTSYMHLDSIAPGLELGAEVDAGTVIGTLGKSAIRHGEQHLHFALEITVHGTPRFIDPTPFLKDAKVIPSPATAEGAVAPEDRPQW